MLEGLADMFGLKGFCFATSQTLWNPKFLKYRGKPKKRAVFLVFDEVIFVVIQVFTGHVSKIARN